MRQQAILRAGPILMLIAVLGFTAAGAGAAARDRTAAAVDAYYAAYRSADPDAMVSVYTDNATFVDINQRKEVQGKKDLRMMVSTLAISHSEMDVEEVRRVIDGDLAIVEVVYTGIVDTAAIGRSDLEPVSYEIPAVLIFEVDRGLIRKQIDYLDYRSLSELLTLVGPPSPAASGS